MYSGEVQGQGTVWERHYLMQSRVWGKEQSLPPVALTLRLSETICNL